MLEILQLFTVLFGLVATSGALYAAYRFLRTKNRLGKAWAYQLLSESWMQLVAVTFSWFSYMEVYNTMGPYGSMFLRWSLFGVGLFTTIHLLKIIKNIDNGTSQ